MRYRFLSVCLLAVVGSGVALGQSVKDQSKPAETSLRKQVKAAKFKQSLMTHRKYTGKTLGVKTGWLLKARGEATIKKIDKIDVELFRIDYPKIKLPNGKVRPAYSDFSGNITLEVQWTAKSRGERWQVLGAAKTLVDVLWGEAKASGKATVKVEVTKSGTKIDIKSTVKAEPNSDSRASVFAKERLIEPKLKQLVESWLKGYGVR